jgi:hypothetical protein
MCLLLEAVSPAADRAILDAAAVEASAAGLRVAVAHPSRWPWANDKPVRAKISEEGGCACSLLSDSADCDAETWSMRPEVLDRLATTLEVLATLGPNGLFVQALWIGEEVQVTMSVTPQELARIARSGRLGTHTRYAVVADSAGK